ncbi:hypothetical protein D6833_03305, partial [Candidatus Parcubacteria bacterium]
AWDTANYFSPIATTDASGAYTISALPAGTSYVVQIMGSLPDGNGLDYATAAGGASPTLAQAGHFAVNAGATTTVNVQFSLALNNSFLSVGSSGPVLDVVNATGTAVGAPVSFFAATATAIAGVPIDVDGDGMKEYAVVAQRADGLIMCQVRRTDGTLVKAFYVANSTQASVLNVYAAQMDANPGEELVVGKVRSTDNRPVVSVYNPNTGSKVLETFMFNQNWTAKKFFPVDVNGDGIKEVALGAVKANGLAPAFIPPNRPGVQIRYTDGTIASYVFPLTKNYTSVRFGRMDRNGDGIDEIVALGLNANGRWTVQVLDATTSASLSLNVILNTPYTPVRLLTGNVDGVAGDEVVIGGTLTSNGRAVVDVRNGTSNARIKLLYMQTAASAPDQFALGDWDGDGVQEVIVRATNSSTGAPSYMVKKPDNTLVFNGMPASITGTGDRFTGNM